MTKVEKRRAASLKRTLDAQGRKITWLAEATGYSRSYVSNVLNGKLPFTEDFQQKVAKALGVSTKVPARYRGRTITVPESIYAGLDVPPLLVHSAYEEAWKRSWIAEHGAAALAIAAERAFQVAALGDEAA